MRVALNLDRHRPNRGYPQRNPFLAGARLQQSMQLLDHRRDAHGARLKVYMPRLDLRNIQYVVDQQQQVVAGRLDGFGMAHLLRGQIACPIIGQQSRHDQQGIERGAQFVAHIGQKFGFVAACLLQFARLFLQRCLRAGQVVALLDQLLGLLLQFDIGLFQFHLLRFQPRLRIEQHPALLFQFLVRAAQLFALRLQFFRLLLRFLQQFLQALTIARGADGLANRFSCPLQQDQRLRVRLLRKADLQHGNDIIVGASGRNQHGGGRGLTQAGAIGQVGCWNWADADNAPLGDGNADQSIIRTGRTDDVRALGHPDARNPAVGRSVIDEQQGRLRIQARGEIAEQVFTQRLEIAFARHGPPKADLRSLNPFLPPHRQFRANEGITKAAEQPGRKAPK